MCEDDDGVEAEHLDSDIDLSDLHVIDLGCQEAYNASVAQMPCFHISAIFLNVEVT